jgi:hypothetical protein
LSIPIFVVLGVIPVEKDEPFNALEMVERPVGTIPDRAFDGHVEVGQDVTELGAAFDWNFFGKKIYR